MLSPVNAGLGGLPLTWRRLLMVEKRFTDTIEEKLAFISPTVKAIEFGGDQAYLRELQALLRQRLASLVVFVRARSWMLQQPICTRQWLPL
jgi:hypothetical protein